MDKTFIILVIVSICLGVFVIYNLSQNNDEIDSYTPLYKTDYSLESNIYLNADSDSFYSAEEPHWDHMPVTYYFLDSSTCTSSEINFIHRAFNEIQNETNNIIRFQQTEGNGDISINCKKDFNLNKSGGNYQVGDALITNIDKNRILTAELNFYIVPGTINSGSCPYANIEVHEILHAFGFGHTNQKNHIMNPVTLYCPTRLNQDILEELLSTYS